MYCSDDERLLFNLPNSRPLEILPRINTVVVADVAGVVVIVVVIVMMMTTTLRMIVMCGGDDILSRFM